MQGINRLFSGILGIGLVPYTSPPSASSSTHQQRQRRGETGETEETEEDGDDEGRVWFEEASIGSVIQLKV